MVTTRSGGRKQPSGVRKFPLKTASSTSSKKRAPRALRSCLSNLNPKLTRRRAKADEEIPSDDEPESVSLPSTGRTDAVVAKSTHSMERSEHYFSSSSDDEFDDGDHVSGATNQRSAVTGAKIDHDEAVPLEVGPECTVYEPGRQHRKKQKGPASTYSSDEDEAILGVPGSGDHLPESVPVPKLAPLLGLKERQLIAEKARFAVVECEGTGDDSGPGRRVIVHRGHRLSVVAVSLSSDCRYIVSLGKEGSIVKYDLIEKKRVGLLTGTGQATGNSTNEDEAKGCPSAESALLSHPTADKNKNGPKSAIADGDTVNARTRFLCCSVSPNDQYLVTGDSRGLLKVWDLRTLNFVHEFPAHRGPVNCVAFRKIVGQNIEVYSAGRDRLIKVWDLTEMGLVNTLFGHEQPVQQMDALAWPRLVSCGGYDRSCRLFKVLEDKHLVFNGPADAGCVDTVALLDEDHFVSGSIDGSLCIWTTARKKPVCVIRRAHGLRNRQRAWSLDTGPPSMAAGDGYEPHWICSVAALARSDLVASGASDGLVRLWRVGIDYKTLTLMDTFPLVGFVNDIRFCVRQSSQSTGLDGGLAASSLRLLVNGINGTVGSINNAEEGGTDNNDDDDGGIGVVSAGHAGQVPGPFPPVAAAAAAGSLSSSSTRTISIVCAVGQEHRAGRWWRWPQARNSVVQIPLTLSAVVPVSKCAPGGSP